MGKPVSVKVYLKEELMAEFDIEGAYPTPEHAARNEIRDAIKMMDMQGGDPPADGWCAVVKDVSDRNYTYRALVERRYAIRVVQ